MMTTYKHIFFDLDDTLTSSRSAMATEHAPLFMQLCTAKDVIVVSGAQEAQIRRQLPQGSYFLLTQNGNHAVRPDGTVMWSETFYTNQLQSINDFIDTVRTELGLQVRDLDDLVEYRGSQVSYSLIGHNAPLEEKRAFDPGANLRKSVLVEYADEVLALRNAGVEITAGGTTCFDMYLAGRNKGFNVRRLIQQEGWTTEDSVYVGDAIEKGRNDESVLGVLPTHAVTGPHDTFAFIREMIK